MNPKTIEYNTPEYRKLEAVASLLQAVSEKGRRYIVENVYFDFGQNWMWTTITRFDPKWGGVQVLNPREWGEIITAETPAELATVAESIRADRYFRE